MTTVHPSLATLADYVATALPADEIEPVRRHLDACDECATQASAVAKVPALLSDAANIAEPMPDGVWRRIEDALKAEMESTQPAPMRVDERRLSAAARRPRSRSWLVAAVTVAVVGAAGGALHELGSGNQSSSATSQAAGSSTQSTTPETLGKGSAGSATTPNSSARTPGSQKTFKPMRTATRGQPRALTPQNLTSYAAQLAAAGKRASVAAGAASAARCAQPAPALGSAIVTVRRWRGRPAVVVVLPPERRVAVFDCRTASVHLYSAHY